MAEEAHKKDQGEVIKSEILKYLKYWYWFVLGLAVALTAALLYLRYTPKVYSSEAKISILDKNKGLELPSAMFQSSNIKLENEIEILKSYPIIEKVVKNQDLTMRFYEDGNVLTTEIDNLPFTLVKTIENHNIQGYSSYRIQATEKGIEVNKMGSEQVIIFPDFTTLGVEHQLPFELNLGGGKISSEVFGKIYLVNFAPVAAITKNLKNSVQVNMFGKGTDLLSLSYTSESISKNERILNELIKVFNEDGIKDRQDVSLRTIEFIDSRFGKLVQELDSIETDIKDFKINNNLIDIESGAELRITKLTMSEEKLLELENQLMLLDLLEESLNPDSTSELLPNNIGVSSGNVSGLVSEYNSLFLEFQKYATSAGENNPQLQILKNQLTELKSNMFVSIETFRTQLKATKASVEQKNQIYTAQVNSLPDKEKEFLDIKRQQEIKQELYIFLLEKREAAAINYAITEPSIKVIENAMSSGYPVSPNPRSIYTRALIGGLVVPFAFIYLFFLLDTKLKNRADIEQVTTKIPVVAELPKFEKGHDISFINPNDTSKQAESFRILSYNLNYVLSTSEANKGKVIYCTSTIKGEGKTYVSLNLSLALSSLNKKVLLIGADLRNPKIHNYIGRDKQYLGLSNYLHDYNFDWHSALIKDFSDRPNHDIMMAGSIPPNPTGLLTNGRLKQLFDEAKAEYDYIIVDTAPTILVSDTLLISSLADATTYITRSNYTDKKLLQYSKDLSESGKLKNMVYVINAVDNSKANGYGYNYGYNYGYGSKT
jgi:capsular exopolysaccharide synthesis family protein